MSTNPDASGTDSFAASRELFDTMVSFCAGGEAAGLNHAEMEIRLSVDGRKVLRQLLQDHLDLRCEREARVPGVVDAAGVARGAVEAGHDRSLVTVFGEVTVTRMAYRRWGHANLHPADAALNLPAERHSHGLRAAAAVEATRGSFDDATEAIERETGTRVGKHQVEDLTARAAIDVDAFYETRKAPPGETGDVLVVTCDGKGVVMRPDALRPATAQAAATATPKLGTRLSKGEKRGRKRMAEVASVCDTTPVVRCVTDILPANDDEAAKVKRGPTAANKWPTASVVDNARSVIASAFDEAERRDPGHDRTWVALVDGANHQIDVINAQAAARQVEVTIVT